MGDRKHFYSIIMNQPVIHMNFRQHFTTKLTSSYSQITLMIKTMSGEKFISIFLKFFCFISLCTKIVEFSINTDFFFFSNYFPIKIYFRRYFFATSHDRRRMSTKCHRVLFVRWYGLVNIQVKCISKYFS